MILLQLACLGSGTDDSGIAPLPQVSIVTQNAGTTPSLDLLEESEHRVVCEEWYENNLCLLESEQHLAAALAEDLPDIAFLQEIWHDEWCQADDRPDEIQAAPYACGEPGDPLDRVLPGGHRVACATDYPDNCIAWDPAVFTPDDEGVVDLDTECSRPGRAATLAGELLGQPAVLTVVHTGAGIDPDDFACRVEQLQSIQAALEALPADTLLLLGGDVNHDPTWLSDDAVAFAELLEAAGLTRLEDDGPTMRLVGYDLDVVAVRGVDGGDCTVRFADEGVSPAMFDHALVSCSPTQVPPE